MSRLTEVVELIVENPQEGYQKLKALMQEKASKKNPSISIDLSNLLTALNDNQKTTFLTIVAKSLEGRKIDSVNLSKNELNAKQIAVFIKNFKCERDVSLNASDNNLGKSAADLAKSLQGKQITRLDLTRTQMDDAALMAFGKQLRDNELIQLNLKENAFSSAGLAQFAKYLAVNKIRHFIVSGNPIAANDAATLGANLQNSQVQKLDATHCSLTNKGFVQLIQGLAQGPVKDLDLSNNNIGNTGAKEASVHFENTQIQSVKMWNNHIKTQGVCDLLAHLKYSKLTYVNLSFNGKHELAPINIALKNTPVSEIHLDLSCITKQEREEHESILQKNAQANALVRTYKSAKEPLLEPIKPLSKRDIGIAAIGSFSSVMGFEYFSGLFKTGVSFAILAVSTLALGVIGACLGLATVYALRNQYGVSAKQKYKQAYEYDRKYAVRLARKLDEKEHSDIITSFAKAFNEAPNQSFDDEGNAVRNGKTKHYVLREQVAKLKREVHLPVEPEKNMFKRVMAKVF